MDIDTQSKGGLPWRAAALWPVAESEIRLIDLLDRRNPANQLWSAKRALMRLEQQVCVCVLLEPATEVDLGGGDWRSEVRCSRT